MSENTNDLNEAFEEEMIDATVITVPIDTTLSNSGEAAEAAAVGAALALKADKSELGAAITVNGQEADLQGKILVSAVHVPVSTADSTSVADKLTDLAAMNGETIPVSSASGALSIAAAIADGLSVTADEIPLTDGSTTMVSDELTRLDTVKGAVKTVNGKQPASSGNVQVEEVDYARNLVAQTAQQGSGSFTERMAGGNATIKDGAAQLQQMRGMMVHTGVVEESITVVPSTDSLIVTYNRAELIAALPGGGTKTLTYTSSWSEDPGDYGLTVTGSATNGDTIGITYVAADRGLITVATPTGLTATGWNLFKYAQGYARVLKYPYKYHIGGEYSGIGFTTTIGGTTTPVTVDSNGSFTVSADGYIYVTNGDNSTTYITPEWSNWTAGKPDDVEWASYSESTVDVSAVMTTNFPYGLMAVENTYDEINFQTKKWYSRIQRVAYSDETIAAYDQAGRIYEADEDYIYVVRLTEDVESGDLSESLTGVYTASDHGLEKITGSTIGAYCLILYGNNLVNKLERDVLVRSQQVLEASEQAQVRTNIGAASAADLSTLSDSVDGCAKMTKLAFTSAASYQINIPSNSAHLIIASGGGQRLWIGYVTTSSTGSVQAVEITHGSAFSSITTSTANKVTFTWTSASVGRVTAIPITGNEISK